MNKVEIFNKKFFDKLSRSAEKNHRRRQHYNIHSDFDDPCQRLFNSLQCNTYIRPHRHLSDPKEELLVAVCGYMAVILFSEKGQIVRVIFLSPYAQSSDAASVVEISPQTWHTIVALKPNSVLLEIKAGPFDLTSPKDLASWAPKEGTTDASLYLKRLIDFVRA